MTLFTLALLSTVALTAAYDCSDYSLNICFQIFLSNGFDINHDDVPSWTDSVNRLNKRCSTYNSFSKCMQTVTPSCNQTLQMLIGGWDEAYNFLCTANNKQVYLSNQNCFNDPDIQAAVNDLALTYSNKIASNGNGLCKYMDDYLGSLTDLLTSQCSQDAADWQQSWDKGLYDAQMKAFQCPGWGDNNPSSTDSNSGPPSNDGGAGAWVIILAIVLIVTVLMLIIGIVSMVLFIVRKRKERLRMQRNQEMVGAAQMAAPPPYNTVYFTQSNNGTLEDGTASGQMNSEIVFGDMSKLPLSMMPPPYIDQPVPAYDNLPAAAAAEAATGVTNQAFEDGKELKEDGNVLENPNVISTEYSNV